jgi:nucleoside-diphosphate-sugar epimerase/predicted dehydrogenase
MGKADKPFRVGFVGTGYIADWHAQALRAVRGTTLVAVCDKNLTRARSFAERQRVAGIYDSLETMLADRQLALDAVHVLLPPELHAGATRTIVDAGIHAFLEKPMAISVQDCAELIEQAKARGVKIGIGHNFLFSPVYESLRNDLKDGKIGRPDQITITWNRALDQLQSGPFSLWMLRDPRNIMLEIGPHSAAHLLDLADSLELTGVRVSNPLDLPSGIRFYRRWQVDSGTGATAATLNFSFASGFTEHTIHVRGSLASATVDFIRNTYVLHQHTKYGLDYNNYRMTSGEAGSLKAQARATFANYALSKFKLATPGGPYGLSITRALQSFYGRLSEPIDSRLSPELGRNVVDLCVRIGQMAAIEPAPVSPNGSLPTAEKPQRAPDILVLGATGFIGQELARQLVAKGHTIRVLVRDVSRLPADLHHPQVDVVIGDLARDADMTRSLEGIQYVYHLARAHAKTWNDFLANDVEVTRKLAEACLAKGVKRFIYTGTIDSYYAGGKAGTITEQTPLDPQIKRRNTYARAKAASEDLLIAMHREKGLPLVIFRPGIVIGQGGSPYHWGVGMWSWNAVCQVWGRGDNALPLVLVEDVASALVAGLDAPNIEGESFNLVADTDITAYDYLHALEKHAGVSFQKISVSPWKFYATDMVKWVVKQLVRHPDRRRPSYRDWESRTQRAHFDCSKAKRMLNWNPASNRAEIIERGIELPAEEVLA